MPKQEKNVMCGKCKKVHLPYAVCKPEEVKNHFIFCCNNYCLSHKMARLAGYCGRAAKVNQTERKIVVGSNHYFYFTDINHSLDRLHGMRCADYSVCDDYVLSPEARKVLKVIAR